MAYTKDRASLSELHDITNKIPFYRSSPFLRFHITHNTTSLVYMVLNFQCRSVFVTGGRSTVLLVETSQSLRPSTSPLSLSDVDLEEFFLDGTLIST